ncbi:hypothetical protein METBISCDRAFT_3872, partial [Metschnikowia bicuspidata]
GDAVPSGNVPALNSHFRGRYTIQYLPESSVALNPFGATGQCVGSAPLKLPVQFNTTNDVGFMQIEHVSPENVRTLLNYTRKYVHRLASGDFLRYVQLPGYVTNDPRVFYAELDVTKPGRYRMARVTDLDGLNIRATRSEFTVGACPAASFAYPGAELEYTQHVCVTRDATHGAALPNWTLPLVAASGVMPLTVAIFVALDGKHVAAFNTTLGDALQDRLGLAWLQTQSIVRNSVEQQMLRAPVALDAGQLRFRVESVTDASGVRMLYNPASYDPEVSFEVLLKRAAHVDLVDPDPARLLLHTRPKNLQVRTHAPLAYPFSATVQYRPADGADAESRVYTFRSADELRAGVEVTRPGQYALILAHDRYCACVRDAAVPLQLTEPLPPTVTIRERAIADKYVGTIGYEFNVTFTGAAPFEVVYEVYKNVSGVVKPILSERGLKEHWRRSDASHLSFQYLPEQEGNYVLVFKGVRDANYRDTLTVVPSGTGRFATYVAQRSRYSFSDSGAPHTLRLCKGAAATVPVRFNGNFPFSFRCEIARADSGSVVSSHSVQNHFNATYAVDVPAFARGGEYVVRLVDVVDGLGCTAASAQEEVHVVARDDVPQLRFQTSGERTVAQGEPVHVPVALQASRDFAPGDHIVYRIADLHNHTHSQLVTVTAVRSLRFDSKGVYSLVSFTNGGCAGEVARDVVTVRHHPKPSLELAHAPERVVAQLGGAFRLNSICQRASALVHVRLTGRRPFTVQYDIAFPNGRTKKAAVRIDNDALDVPLPSSQHGAYRVTFTRVADAMYDKDVLDQLAHRMEPQEVAYDVRPAPELAVRRRYVQVCEIQVRDAPLVKLPVVLSGSAPFAVRGRILYETNGPPAEFTFHNASGDALNLADALFAARDALSVGEHLVVFDCITDAHGCEHTLGDDANIKLSVTRMPSITRVHPEKHCCVGDYVAYGMSGIAPFLVAYEFDGQLLRAESGPRFVRLALKPGRLAIVSLQDSSAGLCIVNYTDLAEAPLLELVVHDLPSVEISHGDSIIKNLQQGDQTDLTFKFSGVPPFLVTYVRTVGGHRQRGQRETEPRRVVETRTVDDVWKYKHTVLVSLEGTYEAIRVRDAFCQVEREVSEVL